MARASRWRTFAAAAALITVATPAAAASADLEITVPVRFLGGPIWQPALFAPGQLGDTPPVAGRPSVQPLNEVCEVVCVMTGDDAEVEVGPPTPVPDGTVIDRDGIPDGVAPEEGPEVEVTPIVDPALDAGDPPPEAGPVPDDGPPPALPPSMGDISAASGGLVSPTPAGWLRWETPVLRWRGQAGARSYNVQVFRGARRVLNAWTRRSGLRVPDGVLDQGRSYVWVVWPSRDVRPRGRFGAPVGRSTFAVTLRPRIVPRGLRRGILTGEVRPRIPGGILRVNRPGRRPATVRIPDGGVVRLPVGARGAGGVGVVLVDRGAAPPIGLRANTPAR